MKGNKEYSITIGIDASNIRRGGGVTHLVELLRSADVFVTAGIRVIVWGGSETLLRLEDRPWLTKINPGRLNGGLIQRSLWQKYSLSSAAVAEGCDILLIPGGSFSGNFRPVVSMSQNLLPFEFRELMRYGWSLTTLRLIFLRFLQARSFRKSEGIIFLSRYSKEQVEEITGNLRGLTRIIPHGLSNRFLFPNRIHRPISAFSRDNPLRIVYVSIVDQYKHPWHLVKAVALLRNMTGWPLALDLVGPAYLPALKRLRRSLQKYDPGCQWAKFHGPIPNEELHGVYARSDVGVFASSCEAFGIILLESMAAGLPIACSHRGPSREILGDSGRYFDPEDPEDICRILKKLIESSELRTELGNANFARALSFTWGRCAEDTFDFLELVSDKYRKDVSTTCVV